ncbi:MAG: SH3 domain-containing protein [Sphingomonadaceae bacterium]
MRCLVRLALSTCLLAGAVPAAAQGDDVPYWASIRAEEVNMRVGPATSYKIEWVYRRVGLPLKVLRKMEGWRLVEDPDGEKGWMLGRFLSRKRAAIVTGNDPAEIREEASAAAKLMWRVEPGVTGELGSCEKGWCAFAVGRHKGYVAQERIWGVGEP